MRVAMSLRDAGVTTLEKAEAVISRIDGLVYNLVSLSSEMDLPLPIVMKLFTGRAFALHGLIKTSSSNDMYVNPYEEFSLAPDQNEKEDTWDVAPFCTAENDDRNKNSAWNKWRAPWTQPPKQCANKMPTAPHSGK